MPARHLREDLRTSLTTPAARDRELAKACELIQWLTDPSSVEENTLAIQLAPAFLARHQPRKETT